MTMPNAIFAGLTLIAAALYLGRPDSALSQAQGDRPWFFKDSKKGDQVWMANSQTGELFACDPTQCTRVTVK